MFVSVRSSGGLGYTNILRRISKYRLTLTNNLENHFRMRFSPGSVVAGRLLVGGGWWVVVGGSVLQELVNLHNLPLPTQTFD